MRSCRWRSSAPPRAASRRSLPADVLVVGDTPHDVACAHAAGATAIGVATGGYTADELRACGAEIVFDTLKDTPRVIDLMKLK